MVKLVNVRVLALPFLQDRSYTYIVPESLKNEIVPGTFVTVPFGFHNKYETALVESAFDSINDEDSLKTVIRLSTTEYSLSEKMMEMVDYLRENTFCSTLVDRIVPGRIRDAEEVKRLAEENGLLIRDASNFAGLDERCFRIATQTREENDRLVEAMSHILKTHE